MLLLQIFMSVEMLENILPIHSKIPEPNFYIFVMVLYPTYIQGKNNLYLVEYTNFPYMRPKRFPWFVVAWHSVT